MGDGIGIGMALQSELEGNADPAEDEGASGDEAMGVVPDPGSGHAAAVARSGRME
jgi:hypothetical protein